MRSLPLAFENNKNASLISTQTVCEPASSAQVLHRPSRRNPVNGLLLQGDSSLPRTLIEGARTRGLFIGFLLKFRNVRNQSLMKMPLRMRTPQFIQSSLSRNLRLKVRQAFLVLEGSKRISRITILPSQRWLMDLPRLLKRLKTTPSTEIKNTRIRVPDYEKAELLARCYVKYRLNLL